MVTVPNLNSGTNLARSAYDLNSLRLMGSQGGVDYPLLGADLAWSMNGGYIDPHHPTYGAKGNCVGGHDGVVSGGTTFSSAGYAFTSAHVGAIIVLNGTERTITAVAGGNATLSSSVSNGTGIQWYAGHDDTAAIHAALQAAKSLNVAVGASVSQSSSSGPYPRGGIVVLRPRGYLVRNTQGAYDGGKNGAIVVPRRCGLISFGGFASAHIVLAPGNIGHGICNESYGNYDDFITIGNIGVFGNRGQQSSGCLDGLSLSTTAWGYLRANVFNRVFNVHCMDIKRNGFSFYGNGECDVTDCVSGWSDNYGFYLDALNDTRFNRCVALGAQKTGFRIWRSANIHLTNCKSSYSGAGGGSNDADSCGYYLGADVAKNGQVLLSACEAQEQRGSGFVIESGYSVLSGCMSLDPSRDALAGSSPPSIRAGYHLKGNATGNTFVGCVAAPSLGIWDTTPHTGTHAVYLAGDAGVNNNRGDIYSWPGSAYQNSGAAKGGTGTTNGNNTRMRCDGTAFT